MAGNNAKTDAPTTEVAFSSIKANDFNAEPLTDLVGKPVHIKAVEMIDSEYQGTPTKVPVLIMTDGSRRYTYSKVIGKSVQSKEFTELIAAGKTVTATLREKRGKNGTYQYFE